MRVATVHLSLGASTHWQLYYNLKGFSRRWFGVLSAGRRSIQSYDEVVNINQSSPSSSYTRRAVNGTSRGGKSSFLRKQKRTNCFSRRSSTFESIQTEKNLSDEDVNHMLWENEHKVKVKNSSVIVCESNQLASNQPNEDQIIVTQSLYDDGLLCGILDGHGGSVFGEYVKVRLPYYLYTALAERSLSSRKGIEVDSLFQDLINNTSDVDLSNHVDWLQNFKESFILKTNNLPEQNAGNIMSYVSNPLRQIFGTAAFGQYEIPTPFECREAMRTAFLQLDEDTMKEIKAQADSHQLDSNQLKAALSGCCALIAYLNTEELFVANLGDCRAVLGNFDNGKWSTVQLTVDHTAVSNPDEVKRILSEHPIDERRSCIQYGRLLGRLAPLRALGDMQFKLTADELNKVFEGLPKFSPMSSLRTPPYLSAEPEIFHYKIEKDDRFIVLASDGLWDMLSNEEVVELVSAYIEGKKIDLLKEKAHVFGVQGGDDIIHDPNAFIDTESENCASFLIRCALAGYDRNNIRSMLTLPYPDVRYYRDDISVIVIFLDHDPVEDISNSS